MNDYRAMAEKVLLVMDDRKLYHQLANIDVEMYKCENIAKSIYEYLQSVVQE